MPDQTHDTVTTPEAQAAIQADPVRSNLASLNEIIAEIVQALAERGIADPAFADLTRDVLRDHSHALGFVFQGVAP